MSEEKETKEEAGSAVPFSEPFSDVGDWLPFGVSFPSRLDHWLRDLEKDWRSARRGLLPALDVHETDDQYAVTVELPGASKDDVTVEVNEGILTVRGEKKSEREEKKEQRRVIERSYGTFSRSFSLPGDAEVDKIAASFENGVLTLTIPKSEAAKPRTVAIK